MTEPILSKSRYVLGRQCPKALWLSKHRRDLMAEPDAEMEARFAAGEEVGLLAQRVFPGGVLIDAPYWNPSEGERLTRQAMEGGARTLYEATASTEDGSFSRIDILQKADNGRWDLIEVKSSTSVKDYHLYDLGFQLHVFRGAGYDVGRCFLLLIDKTYVREGEVDPARLFYLEDATETIEALQEKIAAEAPAFAEILSAEEEPSAEIGAHCFSPFECAFRQYCWAHVPAFSVYDVFNKTKAEQLAREIGGYDLSLVPTHHLPGGRRRIDITCHLQQSEALDREAVQVFLEGLEYPLRFLDYETVNHPIPLYERLRPYQQAPFQFSMHVQDAPGGEPTHHEFLHRERGDPRRAFAEALLESAGETGSVVVYNQTFEESRNRELAEAFPDLADRLTELNTRLVDLMVPFRERSLYRPSQQGSHSIKAVLPAYTDLSYEDLAISHGGEAMRAYLAFASGATAEEVPWEDLVEYCRLDTLAMVHLLEKMRELVR